MSTIAEWITQARTRLERAGIQSASIEAQLLAAHVLRVDRTYILTHPEADFSELAGESLLQRRENQEPLAYILGWREFYGRRFTVRPGVLIPRHETETLVEAALESIDEGAATVLDLGTGSGCIGITLKLERPGSQVTACDISAEALEVAEQNAKDLAADVDFILSDGFTNLRESRFDLIVSNPPYIGTEEELASEVRDFEPKQALFSGTTGLEFYDRLAEEAIGHLNPVGRMMLEVGYRQAAAVTELFENAGWHVGEVRKDLSGTDRVITVQPLIV